MQFLELNLNKNILIVDAPMDAHDISIGTHCIGVKTSENLSKDSNGYYHIYSNGLFFGEIGTEFKFLCQGTPTEEQAAELVDEPISKWDVDRFRYKDYLSEDYGLKFALESFLSAISAENWYWLVNPIEKPEKNDLNGSFFKMQENYHKEVAFDDAESRTFKNPLIFIKNAQM